MTTGDIRQPHFCGCGKCYAWDRDTRIERARLKDAQEANAIMREAAVKMREELADAIALLAMLNDNCKERDMIPYYTNIVDRALPDLRKALGPLGMKRGD